MKAMILGEFVRSEPAVIQSRESPPPRLDKATPEHFREQPDTNPE
jgi:hypothetical protein